jgi:hypothetical protein
MVQNTGPCVANGAEGFPLGERQFVEFALSLIGLRLAVERAGQLVMGMDWVGGPLALAIIGACRAYELHDAQGEQEEKYAVPDGTNHHRLPPREVGQPYHDEHQLCNYIFRLRRLEAEAADEATIFNLPMLQRGAILGVSRVVRVLRRRYNPFFMLLKLLDFRTK